MSCLKVIYVEQLFKERLNSFSFDKRNIENVTKFWHVYEIKWKDYGVNKLVPYDEEYNI